MTELQRAEQGNKTGLELGTAADLLRGVAYGGLGKPIEGASQIAHAVTFGLIPEAKFSQPSGADTVLGKAGSMTGAVLDYIGISKVFGWRFAKAGAADTLSNAFLKEGLSGATFAALRPSSEQGNWLLNKGTDMGFGFLTFGTLGASGWAAGRALTSIREGASGLREGGITRDIAAEGRPAVPEPEAAAPTQPEVDLSDIPQPVRLPLSPEHGDATSRAMDTLGLGDSAHARAMRMLQQDFGAGQLPAPPARLKLPGG